MKFTVPALAVGLLAIAVMAPMRGQAQTTAGSGTTTPVPVATGTPTNLPAAGDLLTKAVAAMKKKGSAHLTISGNVSITGQQNGIATIAGFEDLSQKSKRSHDVTQTTSVQVEGTSIPFKPDRTEDIGIGKKTATRTNKGAWKCKTDNTASYDLAPVDTSNTSAYQTVGADTMNSTSVWHVRGEANDPTQGNVSIDLYISQSDFTLSRATLAISASGSDTTGQSGSVGVTLNLDYSKLGEKVKPKLPAACKKKTVETTSLASQIDRITGSTQATHHIAAVLARYHLDLAALNGLTSR